VKGVRHLSAEAKGLYKAKRSSREAPRDPTSCNHRRPEAEMLEAAEELVRVRRQDLEKSRTSNDSYREAVS